MLKAVYGKATDPQDRDVVSLQYLAEMRDDYEWRQATKQEFLELHDIHELLGCDGDALEVGDIIACIDGDIQAAEIL